MKNQLSCILSVFCAEAGAKKVYAVEASELAKLAEQVINENSLKSVVEVIKSQVENLDISIIGKVDIIVSEWMGFYLVHEGMLDSIITARDKFLREDGQLFPCVAKLYAAPCQLPTFFEFWDNVHGVTMRCVGEQYRKSKSLKPEILPVNQEDLLAEGKLLVWLDLHSVTHDELDTLAGVDTVITCNKNGKYQGVCIWFTVEFPNGHEFSTSPMNQPTHWKQTVIVLPESNAVEKDEPIAFKLQLKKNSATLKWYKLELDLLDANDVEHELPCYCYLTKCIVARTYISEQTNDTHSDQE
ncbi:protein arginine N-methyltransferase 6 isoform X2 [Orussus abietinus]|uniref:protein arginine N-methyltransferase 6 isoform X2 n=1 Tax=Orussus abietinus TaxID=222816 RepID=UPI000625BB08|nr:protein arginine N-methyltransferase 6 isoform X2 [Orussus abietinus]